MSLRDEVHGLNAAFSKAVANQDLVAVAEFYDPEAKLLPPGSPMLEGLDAIKEYFQTMLDAGARALELESVVVDGTEDFGVDIGRYRLTMEPPGANRAIDVGTYIVVLKRQPDGALRLGYDTNSDQAPAG